MNERSHNITITLVCLRMYNRRIFGFGFGSWYAIANVMNEQTNERKLNGNDNEYDTILSQMNKNGREKKKYREGKRDFLIY